MEHTHDGGVCEWMRCKACCLRILKSYEKLAKERGDESMTNMHDSGKRQQFEGGAVRDTAEGKSRPDLISPFFMERLGQWLQLGAKKYDERNWEQGMPQTRLIASLYRHLVAFQEGDMSEDHPAAMAFNIMALIHFQEVSKIRPSMTQWLDMPWYGKPLVSGTSQPPAKEFTDPLGWDGMGDTTPGGRRVSQR